MPSTRRHSYDLNFKLKIVAEAKAVNNNRGIAREHGISKSMVRKLRIATCPVFWRAAG